MNNKNLVVNLGLDNIKNTLFALKRYSTNDIYIECKKLSENFPKALDNVSNKSVDVVLGLDRNTTENQKKKLLNTDLIYTDFFILTNNWSKASKICKSFDCNILENYCNWKSKLYKYCWKKTTPYHSPNIHISTSTPKSKYRIPENYKVPYKKPILPVNPFIRNSIYFLVIILVMFLLSLFQLVFK